MEHLNTIKTFLELLNRPAFCVKADQIIAVNTPARQRFLEEGDSIEKYLLQSIDTYHHFTDGCLFVTLNILDMPYGATVTKLEECDLFLMEQLTDETRQALALAAQQLREPINLVYSIAEDLKAQPQAAITKCMNQLHRVVCNMADLTRLDTQAALFLQPTDLCSVFSETMEKAATLLASAHIHLQYTALPEVIIGFADRDLLERAVLNLVSNAVKFSKPNSILQATLTRKEQLLQFTLQDNGEGFSQEILQTAFTRYLREPSIEDSRHGLGLGLALVSAVVSCHGGTVLINRPENGGSRVTLTLTITPCDETSLYSPVKLPISDYTGGHDHALIELSDILPVNTYKSK